MSVSGRKEPSNSPPRGSDDHVPDAITAEEIAGTVSPRAEKRSNNAFTELMSAAKKTKTAGYTRAPTTTAPAHRNWSGRDGLGEYLQNPACHPVVVDYDDDFVVIRDKFPKASVHLLLIPRDPEMYNQHPLDALSGNPDFLANVKQRVERVKKLAASELRRLYGRDSASDKPYQEALEELMSSDNPPPPGDVDKHLPPGRNWEDDIVAGVHTHPSMNHMHIHVFSREMHSPWLKHAKHYLSFNSTFLVKLAEFPLDEGSPRFHPGAWPKWDMKCWRCGENFGRKFKQLKEHLEGEFEQWKRA